MATKEVPSEKYLYARQFHFCPMMADVVQHFDGIALPIYHKLRLPPLHAIGLAAFVCIA